MTGHFVTKRTRNKKPRTQQSLKPRKVRAVQEKLAAAREMEDRK